MNGLQGKRIVIAGGASGIGAACAERLVAEGARLIVGDINQAGLTATVDRIIAAGGDAHAVHFDLADQPSIERLIQSCVDRFGGIDGLANVGAFIAGARVEYQHDLLDMDVGLWEQAFRINDIGHALTMRAAIPHMASGGGGAIVGISSSAAFLGMADQPAYSMTKLALHALTRHVAQRWGKSNIRCNLIVPGWILTETARSVLTPDMEAATIATLPLTRLGKPEDIAAMMALLMSQDGEWITGQAISINGGWLFRD